MRLKPYLWTFSATALALATGLAVATAEKRKAAAAETCVVASGWLEPATSKSKSIAANKLLSSVANRDFVLLGEQHADPDHHRWQLQTLAGLHVYRPDMVIGFEMFPRRLQPVLDRWVEGKLTVRDFLTQSEWDTVWSFPAELYLPLFEFARINQIPMLALNVERSLTKAIGEKGWDNVSATERAGLGRPAPPVAAYREILSNVYREHAPAPRRLAVKPGQADKAFEAFLDAQLTWDRAMAEGLASRAVPGKNGSKPLLVGIMGSGHLRFGHG
ncbi:MAG TPA: ChaN family lipoprotein, partial [Azonexus sp.]|nr:ChaN family lipoprotein [Azonexus sp.]